MPLTEYLAVLGRRWWLLVICTTIAVGTASAFLRLQSPVHRASARLEVTGRLEHAQILAIDRLLRQISARVTTTSVAEMVDRQLGLGLTPDALLSRIHAQAYSDTLQIQIDVDDPDPIQARRIVGAVAEVMRERQAAQMVSLPEQERIFLNVVDRPLDVRLVWPQWRPVLLAACLLGLLAGAAFALVWDAVDDTLKSPRDVERYIGLPTLGVVPPVAPPRGSPAVPVGAAASPLVDGKTAHLGSASTRQGRHG